MLAARHQTVALASSLQALPFVRYRTSCFAAGPDWSTSVRPRAAILPRFMCARFGVIRTAIIRFAGPDGLRARRLCWSRA